MTDILDLEAMMKEDLHPDLLPYVQPTDSGLDMVQHPLVHEFLTVPGLLNRQYEQKSLALAKAWDEEDWSSYIYLHERPYRFVALYSIVWRMDDEDYWTRLRSVWTDSENIWQNADDWFDLWHDEKRRESRPLQVMDDDEYVTWLALPEVVTVYRGFSVDPDADEIDNDGASSWTLDEDKAWWFARRFAHQGEPRVAVGTVRREDVLAYLDSRGESEIVSYRVSVIGYQHD